MDCSLPGSSVHGILQARILAWVAISSSWGSSWPRDWTRISCIAGRFLTNWAAREASIILEWVVISFSSSSSWYCWTTGNLCILITISLICMCITQEIPNIIKFSNTQTRGCYICIKKSILQEQSKIKQTNKKWNWRDKKKCAEMLSGFQNFFNG